MNLRRPPTTRGKSALQRALTNIEVVTQTHTETVDPARERPAPQSTHKPNTETVTRTHGDCQTQNDPKPSCLHLTITLPHDERPSPGCLFLYPMTYATTVHSRTSRTPTHSLHHPLGTPHTPATARPPPIVHPPGHPVCRRRPRRQQHVTAVTQTTLRR